MATTRILIVDDELIIRESLGGWLERDGYSVSKAASGEEALDMIRKIYFDILLVDIKMGGMSGIELLKRGKENDSDAA
ncbi:MAG: response regulator, partial [Deltaproteobacteria bacterium]|nr:response regulator [Deltaproteobacteria bacterium]